MCLQRKHSLSALPFPSTVVLLLVVSCPDFGETFLPFLISKRYNPPSLLSMDSSLPASQLLASSFKFPIIIGACVTMCALICTWSGNKTCCSVNSLSRTVGHMERRIASRMSFDNWSPVRSRCCCSRFSHAWMACERSSLLAVFGGDKICLLSSKLLPAASESYRAASLRYCSKPGSRSAPQTTSIASPSVLEIKQCCNSSSISLVTPKSCWRFVTANRQLPVLCILHRLFQHARRRRSPLPSMTMFSNSGHSSSRIVPASNSSAPPPECVSSHQSDCEEYSILGRSSAEMIEVLREPFGVLQILVVIVPVVRE